MRETDRKVEITVLDGTPEKRLFWSIISDYNLQTGITELIDNAIDIWTQKQYQSPLEVILTLDPHRQLITLSDNAGGIRFEDLSLLVVPGGSNNRRDDETIGIFGVGSKRAVVALAEHTVVKTRAINDRSYQIDITNEWLESPSWQLSAYQIPDIEEGRTILELSSLRQRIRDDDVLQIRRHVEETYSWFLQRGDCSILINGEQVAPVAFDHWAYPPQYPPRDAVFDIRPDGESILRVEIQAGLILDRDASAENYGVYFYCNNRLVVKELKVRDVGYFVTGEAGVPHPDASLCRVIVRYNGPAKLMPWNSSKTGINYSHPSFDLIRRKVVELTSYFSRVSRALKKDWDDSVFRFSDGAMEMVSAEESLPDGKLILPPVPRVNKSHAERLRAANKSVIESMPWTLGLVEAIAVVDLIGRQRLETKNRIALLLLDSNFEIALKEFIVSRSDLFPNVNLASLFLNRENVIRAVESKVAMQSSWLMLAKHYYRIRNKMVHERATISVTDTDIEAYREAVRGILRALFGLRI